MRIQGLLCGLVLAIGSSCGGSPTGSEGSGDGDAGEGGGGNGGDEVDGGGGGGGEADAGTTTDLPFGECAGEEGQPPSDGELCLVDDNPDDPDNPDTFGTIEQSFVTYDGVEAVHIRITMNPEFVDNTYGANQCGWTTPGHSFEDLEESDRCEVVMLSATGDVIFDLALDYISPDPDSACGYATLGVSGGEGAIHVGDPDAILAVQTSLSQNFNERGYCFPQDSPPAGDDCCTPQEDTPDWDYRMVYEVWVARSAFEPDGFGSAYMSDVHASPSKLGPGQNTVEVTPKPCECFDPDGCDNDGCSISSDCPDNKFCYEGDCIDIIID
jgi:hypothetical protein